MLKNAGFDDIIAENRTDLVRLTLLFTLVGICFFKSYRILITQFVVLFSS